MAKGRWSEHLCDEGIDTFVGSLAEMFYSHMVGGNYLRVMKNIDDPLHGNVYWGAYHCIHSALVRHLPEIDKAIDELLEASWNDGYVAKGKED